MLKIPAIANLKNVTFNFMRTIILSLLVLIPLVKTYGQILNNDPFKIDYFLYLNIEYSHQEIVNNNIQSVETFTFNSNINGKPKGKGCPGYKIDFDNNGNPTKFHRTYVMPVWWLYSLNPPHHHYDYYFSYDSLNRLISIKELIKENKNTHDENDVYYSYDNKGRVSKIVFSRKHIYKEGFKYRGVTYLNDTTLTETTLLYNGSTVTNLLRKSFESSESTIKFDTAIVNTTFDSLFIAKGISKGVSIDSNGNVIERIAFKRPDSSIGGGCIYSDIQAEIIYKYQYDNQKRLQSIKMYNDANMLLNTSIFQYDIRGLLLTEQFVNNTVKNNTVTIYKYY